MHSFHFVCIFSNVRHGSVTCPICRAHWTQLPRDLTPARLLLPCSQTTDPILRILDDSIANFRVYRRSFLRSAMYDDDDPIETISCPSIPRLRLCLITSPVVAVHDILPPQQQFQFVGPSSLVYQHQTSVAQGMFLSVKLLQQQATDIVLVVSPNGPHLRLLKQSMALVVFSLRSIDRLAIVTYSSAATRAFPLRRMTSNGKRTALQVIDRIFYLCEADPIEGLKKGVKILEDRSYQNPQHFILHLADSPTRSYISCDSDFPIPIHRFHIGFGFGASSNGFVMQKFEDFLLRLQGGVIRETQLRIGEEEGVVMMLGELRCGEERRILMSDGVSDCGAISVGYSFVEGEIEECLTTGEVMVGMKEKSEAEEEASTAVHHHSRGGRESNIERWDYLDPFMARRWAKHLHGYRV
ncbi:Zinc finger (C3HC4-type RING finger) family protein [Zostera marina]|uniref:Zinc finger (C3HC4-type RING finger) family protein n=1 Tax=Zostera marina TaxID=29655 RepID=A0A0K9P5D1_ZOSMR|nr:Zinc finger (C3HC4-type RING finger) family protein [Zostera marina]